MYMHINNVHHGFKKFETIDNLSLKRTTVCAIARRWILDSHLEISIFFLTNLLHAFGWLF